MLLVVVDVGGGADDEERLKHINIIHTSTFSRRMT